MSARMRTRSALLAAILLTAALLLAPCAASAATFTVNSATDAHDALPGDAACLSTAGGCTLRAAIEQANALAGDDQVDVPSGTYRLTLGQLDVSQAAGLTINGAGQNQQAVSVVITAEGRSRVLGVSNSSGTVALNRVQISGGSVSGATGGGILKQGAGAMALQDVTVSGNSATGGQGGGGLAIADGNVDLVRSAVVSNSASVPGGGNGGAGILHTASSQLALQNVTLAGNALTVSGAPGAAGGSALLTTTGNASLDSVSIAFNSSSPAGLAALQNDGGANPTLVNTLVQNNGKSCGGTGTFTSNGNNIDGNDDCQLNPANNDQPGIVAGINPLADNGGQTPTLSLPPSSKAIDTGTCGGTVNPVDQRGLGRPVGNECDVGAFEFEGLAKAQIPNCSRSGLLPFKTTGAPGVGIEALHYRVDAGSEQTISLVGGPGTGNIVVPEGRRRLEYWGDWFPTGEQEGVELKHHTPRVLVDRTDPRVSVKNTQPFAVFVIKRHVDVDVNASDSLSGLVTDPSGVKPISTASRGPGTFAPTAVDLCTNRATAPFDYRVLAPGLAVRAVVERVSGDVRVQPTLAAGARASAKGQPFSPVREPREVPIRTLIDTRRGTARITSSRNSGDAIQDGEFLGGIFQVLQSRRRAAKGLTELRLKGSSFARCRSLRGGRRASASRRRLSRRVIRRLRGNALGRFRTRGRFSAATVRGTSWTVEDRCDGTLTRVRRGRVVVRDFRRRKTIVLRAGRSYLARAPR